MRFMVFAALLVALPASMAHADCPHLYPNGKPLEVPGTIELCSSFFVTLFHNKKNASLLSSELLKPSGHLVGRRPSYHNDPRLYPMNQLKDYAGSAFKQGQLAPAGDATNDEELYDSYLMSNMAPRDPVLDSGEWRRLESYVRGLVSAAKKPMHVVTGTIYDENPKMAWRIPIPSGHFKVLYGDPITVYYAENTKAGVILGYSIDWLEEKLGYKLR